MQYDRWVEAQESPERRWLALVKLVDGAPAFYGIVRLPQKGPLQDRRSIGMRWLRKALPK